MPTPPSDPAPSEPTPETPQPFGQPSSLSRAQLKQRPSAILTPQHAGHGTAASERESDSQRGIVELLASADPSLRYVLDRKIGAGGMSSVFRAVDRDLAREVALKILDRQDDPNDRSRFAAEAQITGQLEHPNIIPVHELGINSDGRLFFTLKLIKGNSLRQVIDELRQENPETMSQWPRGKLLRAFIGACNAVAFSHNKKVIHRDLKPANILLGSFGEVVVTDWGLAKYIGQAAAAPNNGPSSPIPDLDDTRFALLSPTETLPFDDATLDGILVGTPLYMAPEQVRGESTSVDEKTDIYALGATLYEILTLEHAIPGRRLNEVLSNVRCGAIVPPHERTPRRAIPRELSAIVMKALAGKRECRYQRVEQLQTDIERFLDFRPVSAKGDSAWELAVKLIKRNKTAALTGSIAGMLLVAVMAAALVVNIRERKLTQTAFDRYRSSESQRAKLIAQDYYERQRTWVPVLSEDFSDSTWKSRWNIHYGTYARGGTAHVYRAGDPVYRLEEGMLRLQRGTPHLLYTKQPVRGDMAIEFDCIEPGEGLGDISCVIGAIRDLQHYSVPWSGYVLQMGAYENTRMVVVRNGETLHRGGGSPIQRGRRYRMRGEREGGHLRLIADGDTVLSVTDPFPLYGAHRDMVGILGYGVDQLIDNITVYRMGAAQKEDLLEVAERYLQQDSLGFARSLFQQVLDAAVEPQRTSLARKGLDRVEFRETILRDLPRYNARIARALPGSGSHCQITEDGLALDLGGQVPVSSLEPLRGIPLAHLSIGAGPSDGSLEPLEGMPLSHLELMGNPQLRDLSPLRGCPLTFLEAVCLVDDISPLAGMPLRHLSMVFSEVSDLTPLAGMPLVNLDLRFTRIGTIEPLAGMPLRELHINHTDVVDLTPVAGMQLGVLGISQTQVSSLAPLRGMNLFELLCEGCDVSDLGPLAGAPLRQLRAKETRISSLSPLSKAFVSILDIESTGVADVTPVASCPITELNLSFTPVTTLLPLSGKRITDLKVYGVPMSTTNITLIRSFPLRTIEADILDSAVMGLIRERDSIVSINYFPRKYVMELAGHLSVAVRGSDADAAGLRRFAARVGEKRYLAVPLRRSWEEALEFCRKAGGTLASPATAKENRELRKYLEEIGFSGIRILSGLQFKEGRAHGWTSGAPLESEYWLVESDRERAVRSRGRVYHVLGNSQPWVFERFSAPWYFVVEWGT